MGAAALVLPPKVVGVVVEGGGDVVLDPEDVADPEEEDEVLFDCGKSVHVWRIKPGIVPGAC